MKIRKKLMRNYLFFLSIMVLLFFYFYYVQRYTPIEATEINNSKSLIKGVVFDDTSIKSFAPGSDNWPITWAENGELYTAWGDGGGFGGTNTRGRVSLGVASISGERENYIGTNISSPFDGKSVGILAVGNTLYLWRCGDDSNVSAFKFSRLYRSDDFGKNWHNTGVEFSRILGDFTGEDIGFFEPVFCQFGRGYADNSDEYIYIYAPEITNLKSWAVQKPGRITLIRVKKMEIEERDSYQFFSGFNSSGEPLWLYDIGGRASILSEEEGGHRLAVSYNKKINRYLLTKIFSDRKGTFSLYESQTPWGPWSPVFKERNAERWGSKVIVYSFVNKWFDEASDRFVLVFTKNDTFASIEGRFVLVDGGN